MVSRQMGAKNKMTKNILLVIDVQNDFISGSLAVKGAKEIIFDISKIMELKMFDSIIATQDWHPRNHISFASDPLSFNSLERKDSKRKVWPEHCVAGTYGSNFPTLLNSERFDLIARKGYNKKIDSYSGLKDEDGNPTVLHDYFYNMFNNFSNQISVFVCGIATDVCVYYTVSDLQKILKSFEGNCPSNIYLIEDLCAGVDEDESLFKIGDLLAAGVSLTNKRLLEVTSRFV